MVKAVFDTCILIDYLNGEEKARQELEKFKTIAISVITWMEVMVGTNTQNETKTKNWLSLTFDLIELNKHISETAVQVRKSKRIKLPDAIIYASAIQYGGLFITKNTKDFDDSDPLVRIPYQLMPGSPM